MEVELLGILHRLFGEKVVIITSEGVEEKTMIKDVSVIGMGAEAVIAKAVFFDFNAIIKWRFPKPYMPAELDKEFRRSRTITEAKALLRSISIGVKAPIPLYVDPDDGLLIMMYIDGSVFRDLVKQISDEEVCAICRTVGMYIARLHENSIIHGDVTTSNIVVERSGKEVYIIDFGLANFVKRLEDQAIDVHIFFRSVESAHHEIEELAKKCFLEGYRRVRGEYTEKVLNMVTHIRRMGRYVAERRIRGVWTTS